MTPFNRRHFLKLSGGAASGAVLAALGGASLLSACSREETAASGAGAAVASGAKPFGLQLYTLRDVITPNPRDVLRQVADFGYRQIESYEGPMGMFWGMSNTEFKAYMDELGMELIASHVNNFDDVQSFARKAEEAAEIGMKYLICPYAPRSNLDEYRTLADAFNRAGEIAKAAGIRFAYHNHGYTFQEMDGVYPQDLLMESTDPDLVDYELDIYWVVYADADPAEWLRRYPGRFTLSHVKDIKRNGQAQSTTLGQGEIDWPTLLPLARAQGMKYFIVEQEQYEGTTPLDAVRDGAEYMRSLTF